MKVNINKNYFIYIYYALLLIVYLSWSNMDAVPGAMTRIAYFVATLVPVFLWKIKLLPAVIILFYSLALNGYTSSYLPAMEYTYIVPTIVGLFIIRQSVNKRQEIPGVLFLLLFISLLVNIVTNSYVEDISISLFIVILLSYYINENDIFQMSSLNVIIITLSLVLTISYYLYGSNFSMEYTGFENERTGFQDINYVACIIGFGALLMIIKLIKSKQISLLQITFYVSMIAMVVVAMLLNASRGSILAIGTGFIVYILISKISKNRKIIITILVFIFLVYLYSNNFMDLLLFRIENDEVGGGSGRLDIWTRKLSFFSQSDSFIRILFGYGYVGGRGIEGVGQVAFHNDFLAFMIEYGILGLCLFVYFILSPVLIAAKENKAEVLAYTAYMIIVCITLEPFAAGRLPFYGFWLYTYYLSKAKLS